ncbi:MAG: endonuclease/exonuclease/phosphatase family protein [Gammaproteobacteria bacterium]
MHNFRVLTLNIHKGFSMGNRRFTLDGIRSKLRETQSNIVFLQEVVGEHERHQNKVPGWPESNQFEFLADTVWSHYAYGKNAIYQHGHHGNAILSELPFTSSTNIDVSRMRFSRRGILHGLLTNGIHLLCAHLGLFENERKLQISDLIQYIEEQIPANEPLILAGDFNDWRKSGHRKLKSHCALEEAYEQLHQRLARTFPAFTPLLPMDRIYLRGFSVNTVEVMGNSGWRDLSDHCAVLADIDLTTKSRID